MRKYKNNIACTQQPMVAKKNFGVGGKKIRIFVQWNQPLKEVGFYDAF